MRVMRRRAFLGRISRVRYGRVDFARWVSRTDVFSGFSRGGFPGQIIFGRSGPFGGRPVADAAARPNMRAWGGAVPRHRCWVWAELAFGHGARPRPDARRGVSVAGGGSEAARAGR